MTGLLWKLVGGFGLFIGPWCFPSTCCLARGFSELPWCGKPNRALVLAFAPVSCASFGDLFGPGGCVLPSTLWPCLWLQVWQGQLGPLGLLDLASLLSSGRQPHSKGTSGGARSSRIPSRTAWLTDLFGVIEKALSLKAQGSGFISRWRLFPCAGSFPLAVVALAFFQLWGLSLSFKSAQFHSQTQSSNMDFCTARLSKRRPPTIIA